MNEPNKFSLVPRAPGALEKADAGTKRILSGMIADTLALAKKNQPAKPIFTVLTSKGSIEEIFEMIIKNELEPRYDSMFRYFETEVELLQMTRERPFDLAVMYLSNVSWTRTQGPWVDRAVDGLGRLRAQHGKPIIATQGLDLAKRFEGTGVTFLMAPCTTEDVRRALQACLSPSHSPTEQRGLKPFSRKTRPPRIVMLDDEPHVLELLEGVIRALFKEATILTFTDAKEALQELIREAPDLFITDVYHSKPDGYELLRLLTARTVKHPIIVISGHAQAKDVFACVGPDLIVTFMSKPFTLNQIITAIEDALRIPAQRRP